MIDESEAKRLEAWIEQAIVAGGTLLCGGGRQGAMLEATLLESVPRDQPLCAQEAFGPVAVLSRFSAFEDALREVNESEYGLQAVSLREISIACSKLGMSWKSGV